MLKSVPDDIHALAGVPPDRNPDIYQMTVRMIDAALDHCAACQMSRAETERVIGKKKDELITELKSLRERGIVRGEGEQPKPRDKPVRVVKASRINMLGAQ